MKLIGFSPWQHTETSIPNQSDAGCVVHRVIGRPSNSLSSSKRTRSSSAQGKKSVTDVQADFILSTDHQLSVLGHTASKKTLKEHPSASHNSLRELPQWIYTSMPGDQSSFLPKNPTVEKVGAVVDPNSRSVFSLQKDNTVLKVWSLDDEVTGPDESLDGNHVEKVQLPCAVVTMEAIPYRHQSHARIKGHELNSDSTNDAIQGGVVGLLSNGQVFLVVITAQKNFKVGLYGKNNVIPSSSRSRRKSANGIKAALEPTHLFSVVGYTSSGKNVTSFTETGKKRKFESIEDTTDDHNGEITLTTMSLDSKKKNAILLTKHTIALLPATDDKESDLCDISTHQTFNATYTNQTGELNLPHEITSSSVSNGKKNVPIMANKPVMMTQLDSTHVALVYQDSSKTWFATIIDARYGECIIQPFPILMKSPGSSVLQIGGLSTSILAVLTTDGDIAVYDIRRAIILNHFNVHEMLEFEEEREQYELSIASHWFTGILGIIKKNIGDNGKKATGCVQVSFAKVGMFDTTSSSQDGGIDGKALLKGSYNLARAIASSMATTAQMDYGSLKAEVSPLDQNMMDWFHCATDGNDNDLKTSDVTTFLQKLKKQSDENGSSKLTMDGIFSDAVRDFVKSTGGKSPLRNRYSTKDIELNLESIPQRLIDVTIAAAVEKIISTHSKPDQKVDAVQVLIKCIKSRKFSGRNHFDKATNGTTRDVLHSILSAMTKLYHTHDFVKQNIENSPLNLLYHLLHYCDDAIPEHMLISMVHFVLCHISTEEFGLHLAHLSKKNTWHRDPSIKVLEKRLKKAKSQSDENGESHELAELIRRLDNRLVTSQKLFYLEKIVTHSKCNSALLRSAMREGLIQSKHGEVEVLTQALSKLLRKVGKEKKCREVNAPNASSCVAQWLSAVIDSNLTKFLSSSGSSKKSSVSIETAKKEVTATVLQTKALLGLEELLDLTESVLHNSDNKNSSRSMDVAPPSQYGIESLVFY